MKTAIILSGNVRTWDECKSSFEKTFNHLNADIFVSTYNLQYDHHPFIKGRIGDHDDVILTNEDIMKKFDGFNVKKFCIESPIDITEEKKRIHPKMYDLDVSYKQYRKFNVGIKLMQEFETQSKYDCVVKTRCDMIYESFHLGDVTNSIFIDSGNLFPNDCIFITNRDSIVKISEFMLNEFFNFKYSDSNINPPHGLLLNAIKETRLDIVVQKMMHCVVRKGGKREYY